MTSSVSTSNKSSTTLSKNIIVSTIDSLIEVQNNARTEELKKRDDLHGGLHHLKSTKQISVHFEAPTVPKLGSILIPQQQTLISKSDLIRSDDIKNHMSVGVARKSDYNAIANLRISVFGDDTVSWKKQWVDRTCDILNQRTLQGTTCLTACVNYDDSTRWMIGSIECSSHEVSGRTPF